jgi:hypothetical protein
MRKTITTTLAATAVAGLLFTGCATQEPAKVTDKGTAKVESTPATDTSSDTSSTPAVPETAHLGDTVQVGDWAVKVTAVNLNADTVIHQANEFNSKPKDRYVMLTYTAKYSGTERTGDPMMDLTWTATTPDHQVHDEASEVTPFDTAGVPSETRPGGTLKRQVVFDLPAQVIPTSLVSVSNMMGDDYADFALVK